jgi:serine protease AprX
MRRVMLLLSLTLVCVALGAPAPTLTAPWHERVSAELRAHKKARPHERTSIIVHGDPAKARRIAARHGLRIVRLLEHEAVLEANGTEIDALAEDLEVDSISGDVPVRSLMSVTNESTAADQVQRGTSSGPVPIPALTGQGIGIALVDSGVSPHQALGSRVMANVSFVSGDSSTADAFGHGTHLAGIMVGNAAAASGVTTAYSGGTAPGAHIVNVRVLGRDGSGLTSDVIAGIDWVVANKATYNIRVMNLSLGHMVGESAATDPLCAAVQRAVQAGIVVVASAGNRGKSATEVPILGGVTSPGNSPHAITVAALNTWGTVARSDDTVTTYSSRGPTRYDLAVKPDIAAPGNKIVSLEASGSYLSQTFPTFHDAGSGNNSYMRLSGTSMAAGVVTGGIALLLEGSPSLTPQRVKLLLQGGASYMTDGGLNAAGAGSVNFWASRSAAMQGLGDLLTTVSSIGGQQIPASGVTYWDAGTMSNQMYAGRGIRMWSLSELPGIWQNPSQLAWGTLNLMGSQNQISLQPANRTIWGDVALWTTSNYVIWGDTIQNPTGNYVIWGDSVETTEGNYVIWGDTNTAEGNLIALGDPQ